MYLRCIIKQQNRSKWTKVPLNSENLSYGNSFFKEGNRLKDISFILWIFSEFFQDKPKELTTIINLYWKIFREENLVTPLQQCEKYLVRIIFASHKHQVFQGVW